MWKCRMNKPCWSQLYPDHNSSSAAWSKDQLKRWVRNHGAGFVLPLTAPFCPLKWPPVSPCDASSALSPPSCCGTEGADVLRA